MAEKLFLDGYKEFRERVPISRNLYYRGLREGWIPSAKFGSRILVPVKALDQIADRACQEAGVQSVEGSAKAAA